MIVKLNLLKLAYLFTKPLARDRFNKLRTELSILYMKNVI